MSSIKRTQERRGDRRARPHWANWTCQHFEERLVPGERPRDLCGGSLSVGNAGKTGSVLYCTSCGEIDRREPGAASRRATVRDDDLERELGRIAERLTKADGYYKAVEIVSDMCVELRDAGLPDRLAAVADRLANVERRVESYAEVDTLRLVVEDAAAKVAELRGTEDVGDLLMRRADELLLGAIPSHVRGLEARVKAGEETVARGERFLLARIAKLEELATRLPTLDGMRDIERRLTLEESNRTKLGEVHSAKLLELLGRLESLEVIHKELNPWLETLLLRVKSIEDRGGAL